MRIPKDVILPWPGQNGSIPSNWVRETLLDGKYPKGAPSGQDPNQTGGATTHTHTSPAHSHSIAAHTHTFILDPVGNEDSSDRTGDDAGGNLLSGSTHRHGYAGAENTSGAANGSTSSDSVTYGAVSNDPPYCELIFIKAQNGALLVDNIIALWAGWGGNNNPPSNWQHCDGSNGSRDLRNKYLKGASTGADAGATGGSTTNVHDITHNHASGSHSHDSVGSRITDPDGGSFHSQHGGGTPDASNFYHYHNVTLASVGTAVNQYSGSLTTTETVEPLFKKILAIMKLTGGLKEKGIIGLWLRPLADIPKGWVLCDGGNGTPDLRDYHLKIGNNTSEIGNTGGSNTHTHSAQAHSHSSSSHSHSGSSGGANYTSRHTPSSSHGYSKDSHTHPVSSISSVNAGWNNANTTADSSNNEPPYRTVAFIQFQKELYGGAVLQQQA